MYKKLTADKSLKNRPLELTIRRVWGDVYLTKDRFTINIGKELIEFKSLESITEYAKAKEQEIELKNSSEK